MNLNQLNIMLADDDIDDCQFFKEALESFPLAPQLKTVHDGVQLMDYLKENSTHLPDVIFLDINMPRKNGFECLAEIKNNDTLKEIPVVMFSTSDAQEKIYMLLKTGADVYIRKPGNFAQLVKCIHHALPMATENMYSNGRLKYILNA